MDRNKEVSSDRVVVENFFGRVCSLWKVSYATFVWGEKLYDDIQRFTFALTNFHATLMPLRLEDNDHYRVVMARYKSMAAENTSKRAANQRRYLQRQAFTATFMKRLARAKKHLIGIEKIVRPMLDLVQDQLLDQDEFSHKPPF
ncbi:hypothetical protein H257_16041 [Aphanomyces astaci]|uniref:DDE Tnp4 domain-containing protein n=1 Tax=Aphanomyces astaci TaxID=112090 RepID=W4FLW1_APHAT|nr:hypothetical protein H257_16041 [Aphanomyces astaci]ETV67804.1 hypothetical protein H257_16041 [Aphanomyces astaci]|eukprot:XP_009842662.1 hypothetical protein H257_16041 [Aphanomyces astaci]